MESIKKIFKIGYGPSSSHTMGPGYASEQFLNRNGQAEFFEVELYGSLALTGRGHMTDYVIKKILGEKRTEIIFKPDIVYDFHPNGMKFKAYVQKQLVDEWLVFSIGGGELKEVNAQSKKRNHLYPHLFMDDILIYCEEEKLTLVEYIQRFESTNLNDYLMEIYDNMKKSINAGLFKNGLLPGSLQLERKASQFYEQYLKNPSAQRLMYASSLAVCEENASGNLVVTAPTCGSSGIVSAVLATYEIYHQLPVSKIIEALMVAGLIGNLAKHNASISGAEVGCQGEVGVACSMAAAAIAHLMDGTNEIIEYAAEIALEHHLGLTCDPVDGLVQIPCIERNALATRAAVASAEYALLAGSKHTITLDSVLAVMKATGQDLNAKYRETAQGGLAIREKR